MFVTGSNTHTHTRYWLTDRWDYVKTNDTITVHPLDGEIYAQIINLSCAYEVWTQMGTDNIGGNFITSRSFVLLGLFSRPSRNSRHCQAALLISRWWLHNRWAARTRNSHIKQCKIVSKFTSFFYFVYRSNPLSLWITPFFFLHTLFFRTVKQWSEISANHFRSLRKMYNPVVALPLAFKKPSICLIAGKNCWILELEAKKKA